MVDWPVRPLAELATVVDCEHKTAPRAEDGSEYGYSIGTPNIQGGRIDYASAKRVDRATFDAWSRRALLSEGDLVLAREAPVGQVGRVSDSLPTCLGQRTVLIRGDDGLVADRYLHGYLLAPPAQRWMADRSSGSTVAHLNVSDVREIPVAVPPLDEQHRIADVLGAFDELLDVDRALVSRLWRQAQVAYQRRLGQARTSTLGEHMELRYGKSLPQRAREAGPFPVVSSAGIIDSHTSPLVSGPGVVVGRKGTIGSVTWVFDDFFPIDTAFYVESDLPMAWAYFSLLRADLSGLNTDSAVPGLNRENALRRPMPVAPPEVLAEFEAEVAVYLHGVRELEAEMGELLRAQASVLPDVVSGRLRVAAPAVRER